MNPCTWVRESSEKIVNQMKKQTDPRIKIQEDKIDEFINQLEQSVKQQQVAYDPWSQYHLNPNNYTVEQILAYVFVVDGMNFCFWPNNPPGQFEYEHMTKNLAKILDQKPEFFTSEYLSKLTSQEIQEDVFNNLDFSLLNERARILREIGTVITLDYESSFLKFCERTKWNVPLLVSSIVKSFSGFRDEAIYKGEQIFFYKRAQILVSDLIGATDEIQNIPDSIKFTEREALTMFPDYRVPQILRQLQIFEYNKSLSEKIDNEIELAYSSEEEVEIRACTVSVVEQILQKAQQNTTLKEHIKYSYIVDWLLWQMGEKSLNELKPHHRVLSIFY